MVSCPKKHLRIVEPIKQTVGGISTAQSERKHTATAQGIECENVIFDLELTHTNKAGNAMHYTISIVIGNFQTVHGSFSELKPKLTAVH